MVAFACAAISGSGSSTEHDEQRDLLVRRTRQQAAGGEQADVPRGLTPEKQVDERRTVARIHAMWA